MAKIEFDDVRVTAPVPGGQVQILHDISAVIEEKSVALIGANGSGKSTLARLVNGLVTASSGRVVVDGLDVAHDAGAVRRRVGFVFTDPSSQFAMPTAVEDIALSLRRSVRDSDTRHAKALDVLERFGLRDHADQSVHSLSGGQKQLLALAGVLAAEPSILVADEPTTLLDLRNARAMGDTLLGLEQQLVLVTHDLGLAIRCDRAIVVDEGTIAFDGGAVEAVDRYRALVEP